MSNLDSLNEKLDQEFGAPEFLSGRREIVEFFQSEYGDTKWKDKIVDAIMGLNPGAKRSSVRREFQKATGKDYERWQSPKASKATQKRFADLGKTLPPKEGRKPPKSGFKVTIRGKMDPSPKKKKQGAQARDRTMEVEFTGVEAYAFANGASLEGFFDAYCNQPGLADLLEPGASFDIDPL